MQLKMRVKGFSIRPVEKLGYFKFNFWQKKLFDFGAEMGVVLILCSADGSIGSFCCGCALTELWRSSLALILPYLHVCFKFYAVVWTFNCWSFVGWN